MIRRVVTGFVLLLSVAGPALAGDRPPVLDRTDTLAGIDADANGVRDDIDAMIAQDFKDPAQRAAATQLAKALQASLLIPPDDRAAAKAVSLQNSNAMNCVFTKMPIGGGKNPGQIVSQLESATTNTRPRLLAYLAYNKALDGTVSTLPDGNTCD